VFFTNNTAQNTKTMKRYFNLYFTTCTVLNWQHLLKDDSYKAIITSSFAFLVKEKTVDILAFVIMPNHFHLVWQIRYPHELGKIRQRLLKYTAQQIKWNLKQTKPDKLQKFRVDKTDRQYQIWKRNPLSVAIYSDQLLQQKINYVHQNPCQPKWQLVKAAEDYIYIHQQHILQMVLKIGIS